MFRSNVEPLNSLFERQHATLSKSRLNESIKSSIECFPWISNVGCQFVVIYLFVYLIFIMDLVRPTPIRPVYFIFQLNNEFVFEIETNSRTNEIIHVIRDAMERHHHLHLSLPVNVRAGMHWDCLLPLSMDQV
jgi:hypothetical protein